jgi:hypothetical protein
VAFDIDFAERIIKASADAALKRMRKADEKLERAQRAPTLHISVARMAETQAFHFSRLRVQTPL